MRCEASDFLFYSLLARLRHLPNAINIAFYGVDTAHNLIVDVTHLEASRNKEVMRGESIHMSIDNDIPTFATHGNYATDSDFLITLKCKNYFLIGRKQMQIKIASLNTRRK